MTEVLLINMPFCNPGFPSLALGLLQASLTRLSVTCETLYFNLKFAEAIGLPGYRSVETNGFPEHLIGEWIFSRALFDHERSRQADPYINAIVRTERIDVPGEPMYAPVILDKLIEAINRSRAVTDDFLSQCLEEVISRAPAVVGFTSVFAQHVASLSLAKMIKARLPDCFVVLGGANCEGAMGAETFRQFPFIDAVVSGEGDLVFPRIVQAVLARNKIPVMPGVHLRTSRYLQISNQVPQNTPIVEDLDALPTPDYDDFFDQLGRTSLETVTPTILFETSRGCWWGEKQHCTFCGLNGSTMAFRSKSAERALAEVDYLTNRYPGCNLNAVDNILDMKYFGTFIAELAKRRNDVGLFYEVKANLKKTELRLLSAAGVKTIQPGIESLSDNVLKIMRKGVTALQNIQLLKWCAEVGIDPCYNIIWGFPGESPDDYVQTEDLISQIQHLRPPVGAGQIRIDRFSPNYNDSVTLGFGPVTPFPAYGWVYPFPSEVLNNLAYFFLPSRPDPYLDVTASGSLAKRISEWRDPKRRGDLFFVDKTTELLIWDFRTDARTPLLVLNEPERFVYLACDEAKTPKHVLREWRNTFTSPLEEIELRQKLDSFVTQRLMIKQGDLYLAIAYKKVLS